MTRPHPILSIGRNRRYPLAGADLRGPDSRYIAALPSLLKLSVWDQLLYSWMDGALLDSV